MSWYDPHDGVERGGDCSDCGAPVEEEHHAYCPDCFAERQGWVPPRPRGPEDDRNAAVEELVPWATRQAGQTAAYLRGYHAGYQQGVHDERTRGHAA